MQAMKVFLFLLFLFIGWFVDAKTSVAFLEEYDATGRLIQYEPGSRFGHSAIQIGDLWLQSYPGEGVQLITWTELQKRGRVAVVLQIPVDISYQEIKPYLGRPFDFDYSWDDQSLYCSELLAKILGVPPQPMQFNHAVWPKRYWPLEGRPGMSPDKLYLILRGPGPYL